MRLEEVKEDLGQGVSLEMVLIPAGKFMMGSKEDRIESEMQHEVTITCPFYIAKYQVTQELWKSLDMGNRSHEEGARLPATDVSWEDCKEFIKKLNASTKGGYRLPYEAEWEFACRAGTTTAYSFGDSLTKADGNIDGDSSKVVGSYKPNAFGLYDMHGNVWEWCEDWYGDYPEGAVIDPKGIATGGTRVMRGGAFYIFGVSKARSSLRLNHSPTLRSNYVGFRLVRNP